MEMEKKEESEVLEANTVICNDAVQVHIHDVSLAGVTVIASNRLERL